VIKNDILTLLSLALIEIKIYIIEHDRYSRETALWDFLESRSMAEGKDIAITFQTILTCLCLDIFGFTYL